MTTEEELKQANKTIEDLRNELLGKSFEIMRLESEVESLTEQNMVLKYMQ